MNILVTGGCGFIGSNFIRYMLKKYRNIKIINLDKLTYAANLNSLKDIDKDKRYKFIKGDICDTGVVNRLAKGCNIIVNFAAQTHVDRSIKDSSPFIRTNVEGVRILLDAARRFRVKSFIHISTDETYGDVKKSFSKETDKLLPNSPYAASKAAADLLCLSYYHTYNLP
ncbi:unnamed protein product, partial [marine sediment metagenome]